MNDRVAALATELSSTMLTDDYVDALELAVSAYDSGLRLDPTVSPPSLSALGVLAKHDPKAWAALTNRRAAAHGLVALCGAMPHSRG